MDLLTDNDIFNIIKQLGHVKALKWTVKNYSDELMGYLGEHLTLTIEVESKVLQFFVKCIPRFDKWKAKYLIEHAFFDKEHAMLISLFEKFEKGTEKWRPAVMLAKKNVFVFEDVVQVGYTMVRDRDTFTFEEVQACVTTMARFHAQSLIYEEKKSRELKRPYRIWEDYSHYLQEPNKNKSWRSAGVNAAIDLLKVHSKYKDHPNFGQIVESTMPKLFDEVLSCMKPHAKYRNTVVHRDLWMNNILIKNNTDGSIHALFVDYQTVLYCPPTHDLASFLYFNTRRHFRDQHLEDLIGLYYFNLHKELKAVNMNIEEIIDKKSMRDYYEDSIGFGILQAAIIVPITLISKEMNDKIFCNPEKTEVFYEVTRSKEMLEIASTDERYRNHVIELFDEIVERYVLKQSK